ncbi:MAG: hypothetical protein ACK40G_18270 [Cytophagaceae bacterium]
MRKYKLITYILIFLILTWGTRGIYRLVGSQYLTLGEWKIEGSEEEIIDTIRELRKEYSCDNYPITKGYTKSKYKPKEIGFWLYYSDTEELIATTSSCSFTNRWQQGNSGS